MAPLPSLSRDGPAQRQSAGTQALSVAPKEDKGTFYEHLTDPFYKHFMNLAYDSWCLLGDWKRVLLPGVEDHLRRILR